MSVGTGYDKAAIFHISPTCADKLFKSNSIRRPAVFDISSLIADQIKMLEAASLSAVHLSSQAQCGNENEPLFPDILEGPVNHISLVQKPY